MTRGINHAHYKTNKICIELEKSLMAPCYDVGFIAEKKKKKKKKKRWYLTVQPDC
jgi:hypothetical protein